MKLYRSREGNFVASEGAFYRVEGSSWDELIARDDVYDVCLAAAKSGAAVAEPGEETLLAPVENQPVWAAGVTYYRSRNARMEESKDAGGGSFYDRVYSAERPELFFKANGPAVVGNGGKVRIRTDAKWSVPEPELALAVSRTGKIVGYTIGNDMSSRDIEGENPLYLPQAKVYDGSAALGPCVLLSREMPKRETRISVEILRAGRAAFAGETALTELKRDPKTLVEYLFRDNSFPKGCFLMTGTGIVPPDSFTLAHGDSIHITIEGIGTLKNQVA
ncbi:fumarylacetoacetate hydrolase family protein [Paracidobacterium acidisoli]|uniref:2-hydroxyhepta-2,4-diene-1,7-dioate isomerase n=1 Tax=Paracidobacterium acidisoli TaxID=2303751 RepID=A0A372ISK5_9BACT|nr:fumarylacetoacetate hydrolase family protein [Paracidobacterium acidisoli]MBT9330796.1 fumarylacetoacetate hydrolase family protein [Paracidobacterium acidisoli]